MSSVSSLYARKAIAQADASLDRAALFEICKLEENATPDIAEMVAETDYVALLEAIAAGEN
ncbi:MAG: hypothetical protein AAGK02_15300, partial [Pseudomonadota bacterium]